MNAVDIMTAEVVTISPDTPVHAIVKLLLSRGISGVPVVDGEGVLTGLVSEGDLLRRAELGTQKQRGSWRSFFTGTATLADDYVRAHGETAADIMTRDVVTVGPATSLAEVADLMEERRIKRVPVLDQGRLVGIVSRSNLLRAFASLVPQPSRAATLADDASIRAVLLASLAKEAWSRRNENSLVVSDGVVHLWGLVTTRDELRAMELAAGAVPGVKSVQSHMVVLEEEPYPLYPSGMII
jgi:CBS domain-containing protein